MRVYIAAAALVAACSGRAPHETAAVGTAAAPFLITVSVEGPGRVVSTPTGIDCPGTCAASFATAVALSSIAPDHFAFAGWQGPCAASAVCALDAASTVTASFARQRPPALTVAPVEAQEPRLRLDATPLHLFVREWVRLQALRGNAPEPRVTWSIREPDAGVVAADGTYTAPARSGAFHVVATSVENPDEYGELEIAAVVTPAFYDYGGPILPAPRVRLVWRGAAEEFAEAPGLFHRFFDGVNGSAWLATLDQYLRGQKATLARAPDLVVVPHPGDPLDPEREACRALSEAGVAPSAEEIVALLLPASSGAFDFHTLASCAGVDVPLVVVSLPSAAADRDGACNHSMSPAEQLLWAFSHELAETLTDPRPVTAWGDAFGQELADDCVLPACATLSTGAFSLSALWSNAAGGCVP